MKRTLLFRLLVGTVCLLGMSLRCQVQGAEQPVLTKSALVSPYVWTDEKATISLPQSAKSTIEYELKTITREGWGPTKTGVATLADGRIEIAPLVEGLHLLTLKSEPPLTLRFLAIQAPRTLNKKAVLKALPFSGAKLLSGQPFKILSMGDSVTHTGDYESMLVKMLVRATGNRNISFVDRSYAGRSVDASVREWVNDGPPNKPDLGLLMYGLNDEITNVPLDAYLEQYAWIARQLREGKADCVFLQPTPDIGIPVEDAQRKADSNPSSYILRTLYFGNALRPLGKQLKVPVASTFDAVWGSGGSSLEDSARRLWPFFPPSYNRQFQSMLEFEGKGDTIHPNALGHLQIARAVFESLGGTPLVAPSTSPWNWQSHTEWTPQGVVSRIIAHNTSKQRRAGRLEVVPPTDARFKVAPIAYDLSAGQEVQIEVLWPQTAKPEELLNYPNDRYLTRTPVIPVVDFVGSTSRVYPISAPYQIQAEFDRKRHIVQGNQATVNYIVNGQRVKRTVNLPPNSEVGRIPLLEKTERKGKTGWAVGELAYVRYGAARTGAAILDGDLAEWENAIWAPVGEPNQARSWQRPQDNRSTTSEAYLKWAFKAGNDGIYLACRATGDLQKDSFMVFFDTRNPELLGTAGRYYWISGQLKPEGQIKLGAGETTKTASGLKGVWKATEGGATMELFVPYSALDVTAWPASGDLGLSIIWTHIGPTDKRTVLMWSDTGHYWNPRWYGVVRRTDEAILQLPFVMRIR